MRHPLFYIEFPVIFTWPLVSSIIGNEKKKRNRNRSLRQGRGTFEKTVYHILCLTLPRRRIVVGSSSAGLDAVTETIALFPELLQAGHILSTIGDGLIREITDIAEFGIGNGKY